MLPIQLLPSVRDFIQRFRRRVRVVCLSASSQQWGSRRNPARYAKGQIVRGRPKNNLLLAYGCDLRGQMLLEGARTASEGNGL